jgi:hypothetical protein
MLLYLVKHLRPDIANVIRELSKMMDGATPAAFKELKNFWSKDQTKDGK